MVQFSPYPQADNDPNYLGLSKEPGALNPNKAMGKLFEGMGDMIEMGVKGLDTITKQNLEDELSGGLAGQRNAEIARAENTLKALNGGASDPSTQPVDPSESVKPLSFAENTPQQSNPIGDRTSSPDSSSSPAAMPSDLTSNLNRLGKLNEANSAGRFSSTQMNMNAQAIVSDIMQRYPGYRSDILKTTRQMGFGQSEYLNDLKTQINQIQTKLDAKDTKDQEWENKNRDMLTGTKDAPGIDPNYFNIPKEVRRSDAYRDKLQTQLGQFEARTTFNKDIQTELATKKARNEDIREQQVKAATDTVNTFLATSLTGTVNAMGYKNVNALIADMNSGKDHTPEEINNMNKAMEQFKQAHILRATNYMNNTKVGDTTIAGILGGPDKVKEIATNSAAPLDAIQRGISEKNFTLAGAAAQEAQMRIDRVGLAISKAHPLVDNLGALEKKWGSPVLQDVLQQNPQAQQAVRGVANQLITGGTMSIALGRPNPNTGQPYTVNDIFKDFKNLGVTDPGKKIDPNDAAALMDHVKKNILAAPPQLAATFAKATFTSDLFARVPDKDKLGFLVNYANPEMTKKVLEASKNDPDLLNQYKEFIHTGILASTQKTVSDFKTVQDSQSTAFNANKYYKMVFNPETNRVDLTMTPTESIYTELGQTTSRYGSINAQLKVVRNTVADLNKGLGILEPVLKADSSKISGEMFQMLKGIGVKMQVKDDDVGSPALKFTDDQLPSSGHVGDLDSWTKNPAGNVAPQLQAPVMASGGQRASTNLSDHPLLGMRVDDIPEGMSARDFLKKLQERP